MFPAFKIQEIKDRPDAEGSDRQTAIWRGKKPGASMLPSPHRMRKQRNWPRHLAPPVLALWGELVAFGAHRQQIRLHGNPMCNFDSQ